MTARRGGRRSRRTSRKPGLSPGSPWPWGPRGGRSQPARGARGTAAGPGEDPGVRVGTPGGVERAAGCGGLSCLAQGSRAVWGAGVLWVLARGVCRPHGVCVLCTHADSHVLRPPSSHTCFTCSYTLATHVLYMPSHISYTSGRDCRYGTSPGRAWGLSWGWHCPGRSSGQSWDRGIRVVAGCPWQPARRSLAGWTRCFGSSAACSSSRPQGHQWS